MQTCKHSLKHNRTEFILSRNGKLGTLALKFHLALVQIPWCISINLYKFMQLLLFIYLTRDTVPPFRLRSLFVLFVLFRTRFISPRHHQPAPTPLVCIVLRCIVLAKYLGHFCCRCSVSVDRRRGWNGGWLNFLLTWQDLSWSLSRNSTTRWLSI